MQSEFYSFDFYQNNPSGKSSKFVWENVENKYKWAESYSSIRPSSICTAEQTEDFTYEFKPDVNIENTRKI